MSTKFTFTSPDGKKYTVTGPDGATKEQAFGILQAQLANHRIVPDKPTVQPQSVHGFHQIFNYILGQEAAPLKQQAMNAAAIGEPALHQASGFVGNILGDVAGAGKSIYNYAKNQPDDSDALKAKVANKVTYDPKTVGGKGVEGLIDFITTPVGKVVNWGEGKLGDLAAGGASILGASPERQSAVKSGVQDVSDLALNLLGPKVGKGLAKGIAKGAANMADRRAFAALGGNKSVLNKVTKNGRDIDAASEAGRAALNEGIISRFGNANKMMERTKKAKANAWNQQQGVQNTLSNPENFNQTINLPKPGNRNPIAAGRKINIPGMGDVTSKGDEGITINRTMPTVSASQLSKIIKSVYQSQIDGTRYATPAIQSAIKNITDFLDNSAPGKAASASPILSAEGEPMRTVPGTPATPIPNGGQPFTVNDLHQFKNDINEGLNWAADSPGAATMQKIWHLVDDQVESQIGNADSSASLINELSGPTGGNNPTLPTDLTQQWLNAKERYANMSNVETALTDKQKVDQARKAASFGDMMSALVGMGAGGPWGALGAYGANIAQRSMLNPNAALFLDSLSKGAAGAANAMPVFAMGSANATQADQQNPDNTTPTPPTAANVPAPAAATPTGASVPTSVPAGTTLTAAIPGPAGAPQGADNGSAITFPLSANQAPASGTGVQPGWVPDTTSDTGTGSGGGPQAAPTGGDNDTPLQIIITHGNEQPDTAQNYDPQTPDIIAAALQSDPNSLGAYAQPLAAAAAQGDTNLAAATYMLSSTDPQFRSLVGQLQTADNSEAA